MLSPEERKLITDVQISDNFLVQGGSLVRQRTVIYKAGGQGPFTFSLPWAQFTAAAVQDEWEKQIEALRTLGVL